MANYLIKKKLLLIGITIISLFTLIANTTNFLTKSNQRNLQYVEFWSEGIYYLLDFPKNDVTGTGDKLQDVPYKALCIIKACENSCCTGEINQMQCGTADQCREFLDSTKKGNVAAAVVVPIIVTAIFFIAFFVMWKKFNVAWELSGLLAFICMFIVTIPFVLLYLVKYKPFGTNHVDKNAKENLELFKDGNEVELKNEADKIILCDNKKVADTERFSANNYNKLSADEDSNKNLNIISISNKNENGQKRENLPDIVFDDNLKDEASNHNSYSKQKSNKEENLNENENEENNFNNNEIKNEENDKKENLENSHHSEAKSKKSKHNASYNRQESNANRSVKSANKSKIDEESPQGNENENVSLKEENDINNNGENKVENDEQPIELKEGENNHDEEINDKDNDVANENQEENKEQLEENKEPLNEDNENAFQDA